MLYVESVERRLFYKVELGQPLHPRLAWKGNAECQAGPCIVSQHV